MFIFVNHPWKLDHGPPEMSWPDPLHTGSHHPSSVPLLSKRKVGYIKQTHVIIYSKS
ncbi:hypothetical protein Hanom_Chr12g01097941 [Helianthus anomalus]